MNIKKYVFALLSALVLPTLATAAEEVKGALTLARVIEFSAANAPEVRLSTTRIAEGEAKLAGAQVRTLENPKLDLAAGPRNGGESSIDVEAGFEIPIELGSKRSKRVAVARAGIQREKYAAGDVRRQSVAAAVGAYFRVLQSEERLRFARERKTLADELLRIARERHLSGDAAKFEVNLAQTEAARAESDISAAKGRVALARTILAKALGLSSGADLQISGDLKERSLFDAIRSAPAPGERDDLKAAQAEIDASRATISLAEAERLPDLAFRVSYKREGSDNIALGGITVTLPFLNPRPGPVQEARVQNQRAQIAAEVRQVAISAEIEGTRSAYDAAVEAVRRLEAGGIALQQENETLAGESYRAGKINLSTLLQVRRDALETRREYLERLLEAADAGVELASANGRWSTN
ncbi:MAG TPA: TolC family protein [Dongiaceae bacterium]|nr:TolC family protein [Dongiaceae bacterium]